MMLVFSTACFFSCDKSGEVAHDACHVTSSSAVRSLSTSFLCASWHALDVDTAAREQFHLLGASQVPMCFVATLVSLAPAVSTGVEVEGSFKADTNLIWL